MRKTSGPLEIDCNFLHKSVSLTRKLALRHQNYISKRNIHKKCIQIYIEMYTSIQRCSLEKHLSWCKRKDECLLAGGW